MAVTGRLFHEPRRQCGTLILLGPEGNRRVFLGPDTNEGPGRHPGTLVLYGPDGEVRCRFDLRESKRQVSFTGRDGDVLALLGAVADGSGGRLWLGSESFELDIRPSSLQIKGPRGQRLLLAIQAGEPLIELVGPEGEGGVVITRNGTLRVGG